MTEVIQCRIYHYGLVFSKKHSSSKLDYKASEGNTIAPELWKGTKVSFIVLASRLKTKSMNVCV